jgi:hypothetical protein
MTSRYRFAIVACFASILTASAASAGPVIDFSTIGSNNSYLGATASANGITVTAYVTNFATTSHLWVRNESLPEKGLGVCSEGQSLCLSGAGDKNELSNETSLEWIVLQRPANEAWSQLWVSSLDVGGTGGHEQGTVYWSNTLGSLTSNFSFKNGDFGSNAYGNILGLAAASGFDPFANYVMFRAGLPGGPGSGQNNDYLVWGATLVACRDCTVQGFPAPEPITVSLFGAGLAAAVAMRRRQKKST